MSDVVVDAGHGGGDPGAVDGRANDPIYTEEADRNLDLALKYGEALTRCGVSVAYTRTNDATLSLAERVALANATDARLFSSWHCNAHADGSPAKGIEVFNYPGSTGGKKAADAVFARLDDVSPWADRGVKEARFYVLRYTRMPAILIEADFVTSTEAEAALASPSYRLALAEAAARGTCEYLGAKYVPREAPTPDPEPGPDPAQGHVWMACNMPTDQADELIRQAHSVGAQRVLTLDAPGGSMTVLAHVTRAMLPRLRLYCTNRDRSPVHWGAQDVPDIQDAQ